MQALHIKLAETMKIIDRAEAGKGEEIADEVRLIEIPIVQRKLRPIWRGTCMLCG
jgi:hypothetical protein